MNQEITIVNESVPAIQEPMIPYEKEAVIALFSLLEALSYQVMSGDLWWLANAHAKEIAVEKYGISEEMFNEVIAKFEVARKNARATNPMHTMF